MSSNSIIDELEKARKKIIHKYYFMILLFIYVNVLVCVISSNTEFYEKFGLVIHLSSFLILYGILILFENNFQKVYKKKIILKCFQEVFDDVYYNPNRGINRGTISSIEMIRTGGTFVSSDYLKAKYKNISFERSDVQAELISRDCKDRLIKTTFFNGQWYVFKFNKSFESDFGIYTKDLDPNEHGICSDFKDFQSVELEDEEFNNRFRVYAKNEHDVFYILTPPVIDKINKMAHELLDSDSYNGMMLCFSNNLLHIGFDSNKNLYESNLFSEVDFEKTKRQLLVELDMIIKFIEVLRLDNTLFQNKNLNSKNN